MVPNEEIAFRGMGASFTVVGICSGLFVLILAVIAVAIGGRLVKLKTG